MPWWLVRRKSRRWLWLGGGGLGCLTLIFIGVLLPLLVIFMVLGGGQQPTRNTGTSGNKVALTILWWPAVSQALKQPGLQDIVNLEAFSLIAHESGGNPNATDPDGNGTVDAGLMQINSGPEPRDAAWKAQGLYPPPKPYDPLLNAAAGVRHFEGNLRAYNDQETAALYAYNGGTAANGERYDPSYAPSVLAYQKQFDEPRILVWPSSAEPNTATHYGVAGNAGTLEIEAWAPDPSAAPVPRLVRPTQVTVNGYPATWATSSVDGVSLSAGEGAWVLPYPWASAGHSETLPITATFSGGSGVGAITTRVTFTTCRGHTTSCVKVAGAPVPTLVITPIPPPPTAPPRHPASSSVPSVPPVESRQVIAARDARNLRR